MYKSNQSIYMKKHLLSVILGIIMLIGEFGLTSCNDNLSTEYILENYGRQKGAWIEGDNVVCVMDNPLWLIKNANYMIIVYHYTGEKNDKATVYIDAKYVTAAKNFCEFLSNNEESQFSDFHVEGTCIVASSKDLMDITKQELCDGFNMFNR